jgi:hypothetical protein
MAGGTNYRDRKTKKPGGETQACPSAIPYSLFLVQQFIILQLFPILCCPPGMGNNDGAPHNIGHCKNFIHFCSIDTQFMAFAQVIFDTIITPEHHTGNQTQQFFRFYIQRPGRIGVCVEVPQAFNNKVVFTEYHFIHPGAVRVEFVYEVAHRLILTSKVEKPAIHQRHYPLQAQFTIFRAAKGYLLTIIIIKHRPDAAFLT